MNGGSISDNARDLFFNSLRSQYGANVRLIDGYELVALERRASIVIEPGARALTQLLRELTGNRASLIQFVQALGAGESLPEMSVREDCTTEYLKHPCFENEIEHTKITEYSNSIRRIQDKRTFADTPFIAHESRLSICMEIDGLAKAVLTLGEDIDACIRRVLAGTGPLLDP
jgi:hypothetical protein